MKVFDKWLSCVIDIEGKEWPAFSRFSTIDEDNAAEEAWKAALNWIYHEVKADGDSDNMFRIIFEEWDSE